MTALWVVVLVAAFAPVTTVLATWLTLSYTNQRERPASSQVPRG